MRTPFIILLLPLLGTTTHAQDREIITWEKRHLDSTFYSEGAGHGDFNKDGSIDIVSGPFIWLGPAFEQKLEFYEAKPIDPKGYSQNFFSFGHDFNGDTWPDVLVLGFPGNDSRWYENPQGKKGHWPVHEAMAQTDNESPNFTDLTGDGNPEIVCQVNGRLGYASPDPSNPTAPFVWHPISPPNAVGGKFSHGLGVGDVNKDGRLDVLEKERWWEQPESLKEDPEWKSHRFALATPGGAQMYADDFDGDGDNDIITSLAAHGYGLAWYENVDGKLNQRLIVGQDPLDNNYGVSFSQMHGIALADIDGDGVKDLVTGKRYWAHGGKDPGGTDPAVVYWFRTVRDEEGGVDFVPYKIDDDSGVGTEVKTVDLNADGLLDILAGNKKGTFIHYQKREQVDEETWRNAQPMKAFIDGIKPQETYEEGSPPDKAAGAMTLPKGFSASLLASEPQLTQPITFCFDARGRIWVAEAHNYPFPARTDEDGKDRIVIFEDADGNGTYETHKVFAEGLSLISGMEVGFGGVWVGAAPYFMFIPDRDGDDIPDSEPKVLLDGWGVEDTHETLNSFSWGPDGWLYGLHGVFTYSHVGKPGTPKEDRPLLTCGVWRYHPTHHKFEIFSNGTSNPWGLDFDEYGQAFISACVIPHLWHMIQGAYYERQGGQHTRKYLYDLLGTTAKHRHFSGNVAEHAHWGHTPRADIMNNEVSARGGGHAHCGLTIYRGDNFPDRYRDALLMFNLHGHRINWDHVHRKGAGYEGNRRPDFLFANDHWFIGTHLDYGPDGALYFTDWQDDTTCHRQSDLEWDRSNGRLFRVHYGEHQPTKVDLTKATDLELADLQTHKNEWFARTARRLLQERASSTTSAPAAVNTLRQLVRSHAEVPVQLRALWTLHGMKATGDLLQELVVSETVDEHVRAWAIRLLGERIDQLDSDTKAILIERAHFETSPFVRRHLASLLQRLPQEDAWPIAEKLVMHAADASDQVIPQLLWYGIEPLVARNPARGFALAKATRIPKLRDYVIRRVSAIPGGYESALAHIDDATVAATVVSALAAQLKGEASVPMPESWPKVYELLKDSPKPEVKTALLTLAGKFGDKRLLPEFRNLLTDDQQPEGLRLASLTMLRDANDIEVVPVLHALIRGPVSPLRNPAIATLSTLHQDDSASVIIQAYPKLTLAEKANAITTLTSRAASAQALLQAIASGKLPRGDLSVAGARQILQFKDLKLARSLEEHWGSFKPVSANKATAMKQWQSKLTTESVAQANLSNGRRVYNQTCYACHQLFGQGVALGPDITGANRSDLNYLLENILDPNALVPLDYQLIIFTRKDGSVVSGTIRQESATAFTVILPGGTETTLPKANISKQETLPQSLMPEGILDAISDSDARDLIAYLQSDKQVRLAQEGEVVIEGEALAILAKTGNVASQGMQSFKADQWSSDHHLWWTGARPGDTLALGFEAPKAGKYRLAAVLTKAVDYGKVRIALDEEANFIRNEINLYDTQVITTGELSLGEHTLSAGKHKLIFNILGKDPKAAPGYMVGIDYLQLVPAP
ncbi:MAG: c-type cytochrome [Verrucomicrobiaceae bacterium]|nr:c-type cytochrome [Verrucomicrobiaceae bacterium]